MKPQICICCGEPIARRGHALSRNPNVCASCSSMADGMGEDSIKDLPSAGLPQATESTPPQPSDRPALSSEEEIVLDWTEAGIFKRTCSNAPK